MLFRSRDRQRAFLNERAATHQTAPIRLGTLLSKPRRGCWSNRSACNALPHDLHPLLVPGAEHELLFSAVPRFDVGVVGLQGSLAESEEMVYATHLLTSEFTLECGDLGAVALLGFVEDALFSGISLRRANTTTGRHTCSCCEAYCSLNMRS